MLLSRPLTVSGSKYAELDLPDLYNWLESFFHNRSHYTQNGHQLSRYCSMVQCSALHYLVITASNLPLGASNVCRYITICSEVRR